MDISSLCSACTKGVCRGAGTQLCEDFHWALRCFLCLKVLKSLSVKKLEDRASDYSDREDGQITLSLHHLFSDNLLGSDSDDDNHSIQSVARKSTYTPKQPLRKSPWDAAKADSRDSPA